jgi:hypothetical protein
MQERTVGLRFTAMRLQSFSGLLKVSASLAVGGLFAGAIALAASRDDAPMPVPAPQAALQEATATEVAVEATATVVVPTERLNPGEPRTDCPAGWSFYNDPDGYFSLCYPPNVAAFPGRSQSPGLGTLLTVAEPVDPLKPTNSFAMHIAWSDHSSFASGPPTAASCSNETGTTTNATLREFVQRLISGRNAIGCHWRGQRGLLLESGQLRMDTPFAKDGSKKMGYVRVSVNYSGPEYVETFQRADAILQTLRLP